MIKNIFVIQGIIFLLIFQSLSAQNRKSRADAIIGTWLMPDNEGIIEIYKDGNLYNGKIIWMQEKEKDGSPLKDKENPIDSLRNRPVEGLQVMTGFKYQGENRWDGGTFYAPKKGREVEPEFILIDKDHLNIKISIFIFSLTIELTKINKDAFLNKTNFKG